MIPDDNFIVALFNINPSEIGSLLTRATKDSVIYEITLKRKPMTCSFCRSPMIGHDHKIKKIDHPAIRDRKGVIMYHANRYICKQCKKTCFEFNPFSLPGFNSSTFLLQNAMKMISNLNYTLDMISKELNISTTQLNTYIDSFITIPPMELPENLGIDEFHSNTLSRRSASYLCILVDNNQRCVYDVLDSRSKYHLSKHFGNIPRSERIKVKYVTIDMWEPYRDIARIYFPEAIIAVDPFHVIKHLCDDFERLRISLMKKCDYHSNGYYLLKKWNWLLTRDDVDLDNERVYNHRFGCYLNRKDIQNIIFDTFPILRSAYELKEYYRRFNKTATYEEACERMDSIIKLFADSNIPEYDEFVRILANWKSEILNSFKRLFGDRKLSNSFTENINGKLRTYLNVSRGISNFQRFRKRVIFALNHKVHYALTSSLHSEKRKGRNRGKYDKPVE